MLNVQSFGDKHPGKRRKNNEDFVAWFEPTEPAEINASGNLYILADGVGGASEGERASQYAAQKVLHEYYQPSGLEPGERLRKLMTQASDEIYNYTEQSGRFRRMATTMVAVVVRAGKLIVASVGDSRVYLIRDGASTQLTRDHSIVGEMVANGDMTEKEALSSKIKNRLTRSLGGELEVHVDVHSPIPLKAGDKILLCSDGLTRYALREDIDKLTADGSPHEIVERIIQYANHRGGADNVSAILIAYGEVAVLEPTLRIQRPLQPLSIEETLDTIPKIRSFKEQRFSRQIWAVGILGILGIIAITSLIIGIPGTSLQLTLSPTTSFTTTTTTSTSSPMPLPIIQTTELTIASSTATMSQTLPAFTEMTISETASMPPVDGIPPESIVPQLRHVCVIEVTEKGKGISFYLQKYGIEYISGNDYFYCNINNDATSCEAKETIRRDVYENPLLNIGRWIVLPDIVDKEICQKELTARWLIDLSLP